jgi:hypothetical protein
MSEKNMHAGDDSQNPEPEELKQVLNALYKPSQNIQLADELLAGYEIMQAVTPYCTPSKEFLFKTLMEQGFKTTNIDNTLYWLVIFKN